LIKGLSYGSPFFIDIYQLIIDKNHLCSLESLFKFVFKIKTMETESIFSRLSLKQLYSLRRQIGKAIENYSDNPHILLTDLRLNRRIVQTLRRCDIIYLSELSKIKKSEFLNFRGLGEKAVDTIEKIFTSYDIWWRSEES